MEGASWSVHEPAPTPLQKMAARIAWGSTSRLKIAILSLVMSMEGSFCGRRSVRVVRLVVKGKKRVPANVPIHHPQGKERRAGGNSAKRRNVKRDHAKD